MQILNNQNQVQQLLQSANISGVLSVVADDGSVIVNLLENLSEEEVQQLENQIDNMLQSGGHQNIGDGVQWGSLIILQGNNFIRD